MNIALSIGHHPRSHGCDTIDGAFTEYSLWATHLPLLRQHLEAYGHTARIVNRAQAGGSTPSFAAAACNAVHADLAIEFHFNAADTPEATGTETLYWRGSALGKIAAEMLQQAMTGILKLRDRGLKTVSSPNDRGYEYFHKTRMPALMLEPAFAATNAGDWARLRDTMPALMATLAATIHRYSEIVNNE